jgi:pre-mRNA 3'-end-processing factor FIP1
MIEDMNMMMAMGTLLPGATGGAQAPGMEGMTTEMQAAMMQQMISSGMDPSQMDLAAMFAGMQGNQGGAGAIGGAQGGNQSFGGQGGFGQGQNQYGYDQGMDARNRGGNFGRGRGGRRGGW